MKNEESIIKHYEKILTSAGVKISLITTKYEKKIELYSCSVNSKFIITKGGIYKDDHFSTFAIYDTEQYKPSSNDIGKSILTLETFICELVASLDNYKKFKRYY